MRADQFLVAHGLAPSRSAARRLIDNGAAERQTEAGWLPLRKSGEELPAGAHLRVVDDAELRWVSRGGLKLEGALQRTGIDVAGRVCLDVGQSTGGFTDVLLAHGASRVVGVDVGHGQLHARLRADRRVTAFEGINARELGASALGPAMADDGLDLIVGDVSFISLRLLLPALRPLLSPRGELLMLAKPQFELDPADIGKGGIVRDPRRYAEVEQRLRKASAAAGLEVRDWFASSIAGGDGNREFFIRATAARFNLTEDPA